MEELDRIIDQLNRSFDGKAWHGPPVLKLLFDIKADEVLARPLTGRHTIWELVLHIIAWKDVVHRIIKGEKKRSLSDEENWPTIQDTSEAAWQQTLDILKKTHKDLIEALGRFDEDKLDKVVPGASYSFYVLLHGLVQHDLYHAGQIAILKRKR